MKAQRIAIGAVALALLVYRGALAFFAWRSPLAPSLDEPGRLLFELAGTVWVPFLALGAGAFVGLLRPGDPHARRAAAMFFASSLVVAIDPRLVPEWLARAREELAGLAVVVLLPTSVLWFFVLYPQRSPLDVRAPWLKWLLSGALAALYLLVVGSFHARMAAGSALADWLRAVLPASGPGTLPNRLMLATISAAYAVAMTALGQSRGRARSADERRRLVELALGVLCGTVPLVVLLLDQRLGWGLPIVAKAALVLALGGFPLLFTYVVVTHRVFGLRLLLRRGLQHALVKRGFLLGAGALIFWLLFAVVRRLSAGGAFERGPGASLLTAGLTLAAVAALRVASRRVLPLIDRRFFREAYDARQILLGLSRAVRRLSGEPARMLSAVGAELRQALHPSGTTLYLASSVDWPGLEPVAGLAALSLDGRGEFRPVQPEGVADVRRAELGSAAAASVASALARDELHAVTLPEAQAAAGFVPASLVVPLRGGDEVRGLLVLGEKLSEEPYSGEDVELLQAVGEQVGIALENLVLARRVAEQEKLRREVQIAQEVQARLLPGACPSLSTLACVGSCRPARGVGGDYYDFVPLANGRLGLALGDVSGKGVSAALLMSNLHALLRSHAPLRGDEVASLMRELCGRLYEATDGARYATFFYGVFEEAGRKLRYVNAGHVPPIVVRPDGASGCQVTRLTTGGTVLGLFPAADYEHEELELLPGDTLVVVSDGISEAEDPAGEMFGEARIEQVVAANLGLAPPELHDALLREVAAFAKGRPAGDDSTLLVARVL